MRADRSELYTYDRLYRLRGFQRGTLQWSGNPPVPSIPTPLADPRQPGGQTWGTMDQRGNWANFTTLLNGTSTPEDRSANGVNEYMALDPGGNLNPPAAVTPTVDLRGNLTYDPTAKNLGDGASASGQRYTYDKENRVTEVRRSDNARLLEMDYDALGRRIRTRDYVGGDACGSLTATETRHLYSGLNVIVELKRCGGEAVMSLEGCPGEDPGGPEDFTGAYSLAREFVWGARFPEPLALIDHACCRPPLPSARATLASSRAVG